MMVVGWLNSIPHRIAWCHTLSSQQEEDSPNSRYYNTLLRIRKQLVYFLSTQLIANSIATSQDVQKTYGISPEKCSVLPFLISDPLLDINKYIKRKLLKIVCVGRLHSSKGQATLIRAVPDIKKVFPEIEVEFIGDGPSKVEYQQLAKLLGVNDICHFVGALDLKEVLEKMASASICVSPSNNEAFGLVNIEAQAVGTPLVASAVDGIMETVLDGETGFLVSVGNSEEFSNKIKQLLNDNSLRSKFSLRARSHFMEKFSIDTNLSKHVSWFENLI